LEIEHCCISSDASGFGEFDIIQPQFLWFQCFIVRFFFGLFSTLLSIDILQVFKSVFEASGQTNVQMK